MIEGRLLSDRYKVRRIIGGGGMANVYLGHDTILDREVAIKVLRLEYANDDEFITRFHREAQSATSLSHPNIVNIYDVGDEENIYYMVMEYVEGMTLKKYIQLYGPIPAEESIEIMRQLTSAIEHAHANNIVHRDIKPQNILIDPYGKVKVTDFGIALALTATSLTQTNSMLGSVHYLSPEQARGGMANEKSDIYSLGIVFFELLTGRIPFSGQSAVSIALKHLQSNTPSVRRWNPDIPQSIENIVLKSTTKDPFYRYNSVEALEEDLLTALQPNRINEAAYVPPEEEGEETKAIPIINDQNFEKNKSVEDTLVHTKNTSIQNGNAHDINQSDSNKSDKKKKKRFKPLIWISVLFIVLLGSGLFALFVLPSWLQPDDVTIPELEGETYTEALKELTDLGLDVMYEEEFSDEIPENHVIRINPNAGTNIKEGSQVTVYSSQGKATQEFSNYVGQRFDQVRRILQQKGYQEIQYDEKHSDEPEGYIIAQNNPEPNEVVVPSETTVIFVVSIGKKSVTLNDLTGMSEQAAIDYLSDQDLSGTVIDENSAEVEKGNVIRQSPSAGTEVKEDSVVEIVVSRGKKEKPPITHSVSFTVPYTGGSNGQSENNNAPQEVRIYIEDMEYDLTSLYETESIREDTPFTVRLTIASGKTATYKVERDDEVFLQKTIAYEEVEGG
ncbi:serine/threonine-protein kinase PrkC [Paraliobacillus quinghaiensis]|uniref:Serine/threonine-protein kinase PrkC n=1 Tax=Paraliobacillus quinghaiensis TaxID=470815 RepID=A0A917TF96_9BACI|nr:Stk1 family PASTA domain-containing Ser/Thr kinase [Paraliobacillus quinghaiensis]GGM21019.1 serine/threonine-protein kinase PrkC [Paraliobacillus quinghaiensis]